RGVRAFGRHRRIELERLHVELDVADLAADVFERALERAQADRAPRARDIRNEVDPHRARSLIARSPSAEGFVEHESLASPPEEACSHCVDRAALTSSPSSRPRSRAR